MRVLSGAVAAAAVAAAVAAPERLQVGSQHFCDTQGRHHSVIYNTTLGVSADDLYDLDSLEELANVTCDMDGSRLKLSFDSLVSATEYYLKFKLGSAYFTGTTACHLREDPNKNILLRRVNGASMSGYGYEVDVETSLAVYDEIYSEATIEYKSTPNSDKCGATGDIKKCIGVNADSSCKAAAKSIPVYSKGPIGLVCDSCFFGIDTDLFFSVEIKGFQLQSLKAGFRNASAQLSVDLDMTAQKSWTLGIDKTDLLPGLGEDNPIVKFKIGPVPFIFWFDVSLHLVGDFSLEANSEAKAGMQMAFDIGDDYVSWDPTNKWMLVHSNIAHTLSPAISGKAGFTGQANVRMIPTIGMHVNSMFTYTMTVDPGVSMDITSDDKSICETTKYDIEISNQAHLHLNLPWDLMHTDKQWGPATLFSKAGTLPQQCRPPLAEAALVV